MESWLVWALASAVFAAATALFVKLGVTAIPADLATLLRTAFLVPVLAAIAGITGAYGPLGGVSARGWSFLFLSALATGASWLCYFRAMAAGPASKVAPVDKLSVVLVALAGAGLLGEQLSARAWTGVGLIAAGVVLVATG